MKITSKLVKPVLETKYLTVDNADRYRVIIRLFYLKYEKLKYWLYQEEVYEELSEDEYFKDYTMEQCQQDLKMLEFWGNLAAMQDTRNVATLEEFKNKKFRYQLSEYAVEIERMVIKLENLFIEGSSLEPVLLERIRISLSKIMDVVSLEKEEVYTWWNDLNNDFVRLNQNYQDYMRELNSLKAEEMMQTKAFLLYKDRLIEYLRTFVKSIQLNAGMIEQYLKQADQNTLEVIFLKVLSYELDIPRLDTEADAGQLKEKITGRYESIDQWFVERQGKGTEASQIFDTTNEIIRKITRYAVRISERSNSSANRREEYYKMAELFTGCDTIQKAHRLSALVFGIEAPLHLKGDFQRATDRINSGVYEEEPSIITIVPRIRNYREKASKSGIVDRTAEKEQMRQETLQRMEEEKKIIQSFLADGKIDFASLPILEPQVRDVFLIWLSKALENGKMRARTEEGRNYRVERSGEQKTCEVRCTDGVFTMPDYQIIFEEERKQP